MKKRILGLALALIMIISLLPLTAIAAAPADTKVILWNGGNGNGRIDVYGFQTTPAYVVVKEEAGVQSAVKATEVPTDNYVKLTYTNGVVGMEFKNFVFSRATGMGGSVLNVSTTGEYDIAVTLEGTNSITANTSALIFANTGKVTIGGTGSLTVAGTAPSQDSIF